MYSLLEKGRPDFKHISTSAKKCEAEEKSDEKIINQNLLQEREEIKRLREKLVLAEQSLEKMELDVALVQAGHVSETVRGIDKSTMHPGRWIMEKQCEEFFMLDEDIKEQLRESKKKRLEEVKEQMKFILDTDDLSLTRGKWDCCGKTGYQEHGCS